MLFLYLVRVTQGCCFVRDFAVKKKLAFVSRVSGEKSGGSGGAEKSRAAAPTPLLQTIPRLTGLVTSVPNPKRASICECMSGACTSEGSKGNPK